MNKYTVLLLFAMVACNHPSQKMEKETASDDSYTAEKIENANVETIFAREDSLYIISEDKILVGGYIQSAGLDNIQNTAYNRFAPYQLISLKNSFFLISNEPLRPFWGRCVVILGRYPDGWNLHTQEFDESYTFERSALLIDSIYQIDDQVCQQSVWPNYYHLQNSDTVIAGFLKRNTRPSPDIAYDYRIIPDQPISLLYDDTMTTNEIPVITNIAFNEMENALQMERKLKFKGKITYGYAESMVFHLSEIEDK